MIWLENCSFPSGNLECLPSLPPAIVSPQYFRAHSLWLVFPNKTKSRSAVKEILLGNLLWEELLESSFSGKCVNNWNLEFDWLSSSVPGRLAWVHPWIDADVCVGLTPFHSLPTPCWVRSQRKVTAYLGKADFFLAMVMTCRCSTTERHGNSWIVGHRDFTNLWNKPLYPQRWFISSEFLLQDSLWEVLVRSKQ